MRGWNGGATTGAVRCGSVLGLLAAGRLAGGVGACGADAADGLSAGLEGSCGEVPAADLTGRFSTPGSRNIGVWDGARAILGLAGVGEAGAVGAAPFLRSVLAGGCRLAGWAAGGAFFVSAKRDESVGRGCVDCAGARRLGKTGLAREAVAGGAGVLSIPGVGRDGADGGLGREATPEERLEAPGCRESDGRMPDRLSGRGCPGPGGGGRTTARRSPWFSSRSKRRPRFGSGGA